MKHGVIDPQKNFHEIPFYEIGGLFKNIVQTACQDEKLKKDYKINYQDQITRLPAHILYAIDRLGWMVVDPLNRDLDIVLVSDGEKMHFVSEDKVLESDFDRTSLINEEAICPLLTDDVLKYKESLVTTLGIGTGIVDSQGFVDCEALGNVENLAEIILMFDMMENKELYQRFKQDKNIFESGYDYLIGLPNVVAVKKNDQEGFDVNYSNDNEEKIENFIDKIDKESEERPLMSVGEVLPSEVKGR